MIELDRRESLFGLIRVMERKQDGARLYCLGASVQSMVGPDGVSLFGYVHATKLLVRQARDILVIGGAGGSLATMLARRGHAVTIVDIDPVAEHLARAYFWLDPSVVWITEDALTFLARGAAEFDAIVIDACDADGLVAAFAEPQKLIDAMALLRPSGSLTVNLVTDDGAPAWGRTLARTLADNGVHVTLFEPANGWEGNELLHLRNAPGGSVIDPGDLSARPADVRTYLTSLSAVSTLPKSVASP